MPRLHDEPDPLAELSPRVVDELPPDLVGQLRAGTLDALPQSAIDQLPQHLQDQIPDSLVVAAGSSTELTVALVLVAIVGVVGFFWSMAKRLLKLALFFLVVAAVGFIWFTQR